ncbi:MAG: transcriptional repressor NrdR [Myxococcales bacterium]
MRCPYCKHTENRVLDSRLSKEQTAIRRRRECEGCGSRFTTYERIEDIAPQVVKKDGTREPFDRLKVVRGVQRACEKRPVSMAAIEQFVDALEQRLQERFEREVPSRVIGEEVMGFLRQADQVAYVRFASVYRSFKDIGDFVDELRALEAAAPAGPEPAE